MAMLSADGQRGLAHICSPLPPAVIEQLLARQTTLPPVPPSLVRPHLLAGLDEAPRHRLTLLAAPAGLGNTTPNEG
ncbi:MAG TPA: hypothetical protein PKD53_08300 [Chloroflexaceae bacterium]|nr:hypothetical protein [Chloroflexaceae bacterium]